MKNLFYITSILLSFTVYSQSRDEVVKKMLAAYTAHKPLQYNTTFNLYKGKGREVIQSYKGTYSKSASNQVYSKIHNTEFYVGKITAKISHDEKIIQIADPATNIHAEHDVKQLLAQYNYGYFKDFKTYWELELVSKPGNAQLPYSKISLQINKDFFIQKQVLYYREAVDFSRNPKLQDMHYPRLEIMYSKPSRNADISSAYDTSKYFSILRKKVILSARYSDYKIFDQRTNNSK